MMGLKLYSKFYAFNQLADADLKGFPVIFNEIILPIKPKWTVLVESSDTVTNWWQRLHCGVVLISYYLPRLSITSKQRFKKKKQNKKNAKYNNNKKLHWICLHSKRWKYWIAIAATWAHQSLRALLGRAIREWMSFISIWMQTSHIRLHWITP